MIEVDPTYFKELKAHVISRGRWVQASATGFGILIALAFAGGPTGGWPWLLGAVVSLMFTLYARIDKMESSLLAQIYLGTARSPKPIDDD